MISARACTGLAALLVLGVSIASTAGSQRAASERSLAVPAALCCARSVGVEPRPRAFEASTPAGVRAVLSAMHGTLANDRAALEHLASTDESPLVVGNAIAALGRTRSPEACAHLRGFLDDERPRVRHETIRALGSCGAQQISAELASQARGPDETAALLSIHALGAIGDEESQRCLEEIARADHSSPARRSFARHELAKAMGSLVVSRRRDP